MKKISFEQVALVILAAIAAGCAIMILTSPQVVGGAVTGFVLALSGFLAVVQAFKRQGFLWGGDWKNPDGMHFTGIVE